MKSRNMKFSKKQPFDFIQFGNKEQNFDVTLGHRNRKGHREDI